MNEVPEVPITFLITSADSAVAFQSLEQVLHLVALPVVTTMPRRRCQAMAARQDAGATAPASQLCPETVAVVTLVGHRDRATQFRTRRRLRDPYVGVLSGCQTQTYCPSQSVHPSTDLGVETLVRPMA